MDHYIAILEEGFTFDAIAKERGICMVSGAGYDVVPTDCLAGYIKAQLPDATDLTEPEAYYSGASQQDIFNSISNGAGVAMPAWNVQIADESDIWHLVNFIRSLWTDEQRSAF